MAFNNRVSISSADVAEAANNGYSIEAGGNPVPVTGTSIWFGTEIVIEPVDDTKVVKSVHINLYNNANLTGSVIGVKNFVVSADKLKATYTVENLPTTQFYGPIIVSMEDAAVLTPLAWVDHPNSGDENTNVNFSWTGGDPTKTYDVVVLSADKSNELDRVTNTFANKSYVLNRPAGTYYIQVFVTGESTGNIEQQITLAAVVLPFDYTFAASEIQTLSANHITLKADGVEINAQNNAIRYGQALTAATPVDWDIESITFEGDDDEGQYSPLRFTVASDKKSASLVFNLPAGKTSPYDSFVPRATQVVVVKGSNYIYEITQEKLTELNKVRFKTVDITDSNDAVYDFGQFILGLIELPFTIDPSYIGQPEPIKLANMDTKVSAPVIKADLIRVDLGEIVVPAGNSAVEDYSNTTALIHLPRTAPIALDLEYVIGQTVGIEYLVDVYSGHATINITSSKLGGAVINTSEVNLGVNIPYTTLINTKSAQNINISVGGENHVTTPFIEIIRADSILPGGFWTIPVTDEGDLSGNLGYIEVQNIEFQTDKALRVEKNEIVSLLASGVIIK